MDAGKGQRRGVQGMPVLAVRLVSLKQLNLGIWASGTKLGQNFKPFYMPKSQPFCVIGAVQYEMIADNNKPLQIARWFHSHYAHIEEDAALEQKMLEKTRPKGYHEDGDKIYVLTHIKK